MSLYLIPLHGIGTRHDLPLPFGFVVGGAAVVVVITFALAIAAWRDPRYSRPRGVVLPRLTRWVDHPVTRTMAAVCVWLTYAWFGLALWAGQDRLTNPLFGFVFVLVWVGLIPISLAGGAAWRELHPLWTLATAWNRLRGQPADAGRSLPSWLGVWPAAAGILAFAYLELVEPARATLGVQRLWCTAWWLWVAAGTLIAGRRWIPAADPFTAYADLVSRLSPWQRIDGIITLTNPLRHATTAPAPRGTGALVAALLGATAYDSWSGSLTWIRTVQHSRISPLLWGCGGIAFAVGVVGAMLALGIAAMRPWIRSDAHGWAARMAATCAPIVVGYAIGHYASLLWIEGQRTLIHASDPLGLGWNVFGTAELGVDSRLFDHPTAVATIQLVSIVGGHVVGVLTAHEEALQVLRRGAALRGQVVLLAVMVAYTCAGLLLLFAP